MYLLITRVMTQHKRNDSTDGIFWPSALQMPAAPADWIDLSIGESIRISKTIIREKEENTETSKVGKFSRIIRHGTHNPVCRSLPHCIQNSKEEIEPDPRDIARVVNAHLVGIGRYRSAGIVSKQQNDSVWLTKKKKKQTSDRSKPRYERRTQKWREQSIQRKPGHDA